jgi:hypothetical protein
MYTYSIVAHNGKRYLFCGNNIHDMISKNKKYFDIIFKGRLIYNFQIIEKSNETVYLKIGYFATKENKYSTTDKMKDQLDKLQYVVWEIRQQENFD